MAPQRPTIRSVSPPEALEGVDESTWMDVIHKMDEVYSRLIDDEVALERKNAELEQSQQFIYSVMSAMSDVLIVCDEHGLIEQTNTALCELVGQDDAHLRGTPFEALLADRFSAEQVRQVLGINTTSRFGQGLSLNLRDASGSSVSVDANCSARVAHTGRRLGTVFVGRPTAELKRAYEELRTAHEALKHTQQQLIHSEKMASLGRLVAGVAHELNNPISFVLGNVYALNRYLERLREYLGAVHNDESKDALQVLRKSLRIDHLLGDLPSLIEGTVEGAQRTTAIVNGLKRFSAMDSEVRNSVDLGDVIDQAIHWVRKGRATPFDLHWDNTLPCRVVANAGQLQQVVLNLLQNALDAASATRDKPVLLLNLQTDHECARLQLHDNGPGIAEEHLGRIFDPFFTTKPVGKGTGLGLSISYGIIEQHGGHLSAHNDPQGGAVFVLELPLAQPNQLDE